MISYWVFIYHVTDVVLNAVYHFITQSLFLWMLPFFRGEGNRVHVFFPSRGSILFESNTQDSLVPGLCSRHGLCVICKWLSHAEEPLTGRPESCKKKEKQKTKQNKKTFLASGMDQVIVFLFLFLLSAVNNSQNIKIHSHYWVKIASSQ